MSVQLIEAAAALGQGLQVRGGPQEAAEPAAIRAAAAAAEPDQLPAAAAVRAEPRAEPGPGDRTQEAQEVEVDNGRTS